MIKKLLLFTIYAFLSLSVFSQINVKGTVTDYATNQSFPGVIVAVKGTNHATATDTDGRYSLDVPSDTLRLTFSFIGYQTAVVPINGQKIINIALKEETISLSELVVIGYGVQRKSDLTGAVSSVRGNDLTKVSLASSEFALQGKVSGLQVTSVSGSPGESPVIRVRGVGTLNNSSPIYVVDGNILDNISFLNSHDIESIEVLKDASATAIYGSRGANGVIIITTKQGQTKPQILVTSEFGVQRLQNKIEMLDGQEFAKVVNELSPGTFNNISRVSKIDWQDEIFKSFAPISNQYISISDGSERMKYYMGFGYFNQKGIIPKTDYERYSIKLNTTFQPVKYIKFGNNFTLTPSTKDIEPGVVPAAYRAWPSDNPYNSDGSFAEVRGSGNPLASIEYTNGATKATRFVGNVFTEITIKKSFLFRSSYGVDMGYEKAKSYTPEYYVSATQQNATNDLSIGRYDYYNWIWENTLNYNFEKTNHRLDALAGFSLQKFQGETFTGGAENLIRGESDMWYLDLGQVLSERVGNTAYVSSMMSYLFRLNYTYRDKYLFTATYRLDGSSKFGDNNRYGSFPSVALGWILSNEPFLKSVESISKLKLRASWGIIGNDKISQTDRYSMVAYHQYAIFGSDEILNPGATLGNTSNKNLKWESTIQTDIGIESGFFKDKILFELDFFNRRTNDILVGITTPAFYGNGPFASITSNAASVINRGIEWTASFSDNIGKVNYRLGFVGSFISNKVIKLGAESGSDSYITAGGLGNGQLVTRTAKGKPIGSFYGYKTTGVFQSDTDVENNPHISGQEAGDLRFSDEKADGNITAADRIFIGSPIPKFIIGLTSEFSYKSFTLSLDIDAQIGNKIYNGKKAVRPDLYNYERCVLDRWTGPNTSNTEPRVTVGGVNYSVSDYFIEDGSFARIKNLQLTYMLPKQIIPGFTFDEIHIYLKATNLFTFTKYSGYSPEIGGRDVLSTAIDMGIYPVITNYAAGLSIRF
jgi:TonB-linked SusC/RagA family outer membrane protein